MSRKPTSETFRITVLPQNCVMTNPARGTMTEDYLRVI
jgi:hypothetical protein